MFSKEYIGKGLGHDCFLQGGGNNDGLNDGDDREDGDNGDDRDDGDDRDKDGCEGRKPTAFGWFLLLNPTWKTLDN